MKLFENPKIFKLSILIIFTISVILRLSLFSQEGGDHNIYKQAVIEFSNGINPYAYTLKSYYDPTLEHGYAYLPTLLYIQTSLSTLNRILNLDIASIYWYKIPVLLADIGVGIVLYKILKKENAPNMVIIGGLLFWFLNPYFFMDFSYTNYEPLPIIFLLLSLLALGKKDFVSGILFGLAVSLKTFPIILFVIFLIKSRNGWRFLLGGAFIAILVSLPFMKTLYDFELMIASSLLVHGERGIQGRPILSTATYYLQNMGIKFYQAEFSEIFSLLSLGLPQLLVIYLYFKRKVHNTWILAFVSFCVYILLTPVLNRTHIIWALPFVYLGLFQIFHEKLKYFSITIVGVYILICFYYFLWINGLHSPEIFGGKIWREDKNTPFINRFSMISEMYIKAIKIKKSLVG